MKPLVPPVPRRRVVPFLVPALALATLALAGAGCAGGGASAVGGEPGGTATLRPSPTTVVTLPGPRTPTAELPPRPASGRATVAREGPNQFDVALAGFGGVAVKQRTDVWCWAACVEMVSRYYGAPVPQEEVAARIDLASTDGPLSAGGAGEAGGLQERFNQISGWTSHKIDKLVRLARRGGGDAGDDSPVRRAGRREIMLAMNPDLAGHVGVGAQAVQAGAVLAAGLDIDVKRLIATNVAARVAARIVSGDEVVRAVSAGHPVVVGLRNPEGGGHACVVYGVSYSNERLVGHPGPDGKPIAPPETLPDAPLDAALDTLPSGGWYSIHSVLVLDPWTGLPATIDGPSFRDRVDFLISRDGARRLLLVEAGAVGVRG